MEKFVINKSKDGQYYFVLMAKNNKIIAMSEMYIAKQSCINGIESVKENAKIAKIVDLT